MNDNYRSTNKFKVLLKNFTLSDLLLEISFQSSIKVSFFFLFIPRLFAVDDGVND